ncbi:MAG: hypothetical protein WAW86_00440 [Gammaproteobacteria bacterium]
MRKCLALLKKISEEELQSWKDNPTETLPEKVSTFLYYMRVEFSLIAPIGLDPIKLAENLNECLYFLKKDLPQAFNQKALRKIDSISEICVEFKRHVEQTLGDSSLEYQIQRENEIKLTELYQGIDTNIAVENDENEKSIIKNNIENIIKALKSNKLDIATMAFMDFGKFLVQNYPKKSLSDIQNQLDSFEIFREHDLPPLHILSQLSEARIRVLEEAATEKRNTDTNRALDGLRKSLSIFSTLLGDDRVLTKLESDVDETAITQTKNAIACYLPAQQKIRYNLQMLNSSLSKVKFSLTEKLMHLEKKLETLKQQGSKHESKKTAQRVIIVKNAISHEDQPIVTQENFSSLTQDIQDLITSGKMITPTILDEIKTRFEQLVTHKITLPLQKYNEERGFLSRFKRWAGDTLKRTFGFGKISTYGGVSFKLCK